MKIRNGFVSNSSSSSFCVMYFEIDTVENEVLKLVEEHPYLIKNGELFRDGYVNKYLIGKEIPGGSDESFGSMPLSEFIKDVKISYERVKELAKIFNKKEEDLKYTNLVGMDLDFYLVDEYYFKDLKDELTEQENYIR